MTFKKGDKVYRKVPAVVSLGFGTETVGYTRECGVVVGPSFTYDRKRYVPVVWQYGRKEPHLSLASSVKLVAGQCRAQ